MNYVQIYSDLHIPMYTPKEKNQTIDLKLLMYRIQRTLERKVFYLSIKLFSKRILLKYRRYDHRNSIRAFASSGFPC